MTNKVLYEDSQLSLFDDEPDVKNQSLDYITIDFETANQYGNSAIFIILLSNTHLIVC